AALGLPSRDALEALMHATWTQALQTPVCDVLWRTSDDAGETLLPSSLVQLLQAAAMDTTQGGIDPRLERAVPTAPVHPPQPVGAALPVKHLSASAYEDLRQCPYRFFAMRQLGLKTVDELDGEVDKRDFGLWLHAVLAQFHAALQSGPTEDATVRSRMLDQTAEEITRSMALPEGEFLPFMAAWPQVRDGYLKWLTAHEAQGARFASGETSHRQRVGDVQLVGRIDRTDAFADGTVMVLDYKTEPVAKSRSRVKEPLEDTQIAFYAALLDADTLRGAYVNVGERDGTAMSEQEHLVEARDALLEGIQMDMQRIRDGAALPALGDAGACDFCQARSMCRKDFWSVP
ncbi:MAG TPA: PD-(D/E)XK nuclease family protein, partial [Rhodoferax sp.]|nr:PD-(D/E)XK nuclease family protein [Rhodoferax sp.]